MVTYFPSTPLFFTTKLPIMNYDKLIYILSINCRYSNVCGMIERLSDIEVESIFGKDGLNILHLSYSEIEEEIATWDIDDWYYVSDYLNEAHTQQAAMRDAWRYDY